MTPITTIREIDTTTQEGRLLIAALAQLSTELSKSPDEVLQEIIQVAEHIYADQNP